MQDPVITIQDLLSNNWKNANTSISYDPDIHTGWHQEEADTPQVTVTNPEESPIDGGRTGYSAIDGSGAGPVQELGGSVNVDCWSDRESESGVNPKKLTFEFTEEIKRIVKGDITTATDLRVINYGGRRFVPPDPSENPPVFHYNVPVGYIYEERP